MSEEESRTCSGCGGRHAVDGCGRAAGRKTSTLSEHSTADNDNGVWCATMSSFGVGNGRAGDNGSGETSDDDAESLEPNGEERDEVVVVAVVRGVD